MKFACPGCGQHMSAEVEWVGMETICPACGGGVVIPSPKEAEASLNPPRPVVADTGPPRHVEDEGRQDLHEYRYWAFISYSSKDKAWGSWLHRAIETYGIPSEFVEHHRTPTGHPAPKRFNPVFRDRDELPASSDLGAVIKKALGESRYLIVICSRNAARSQWVNQEIEAFLALGRRERIFAIIVDGEPNAGDARECFPPALRQFEPIAADARPQGDGKRSAKLKLLAGMLGVRFDSLKQRDAQRQRRRRMLTGVAAALLGTLITVLTGVAVHQRQSASDEKAKADRRRYGAEMLKLQIAWEQGDMPTFVALLDAQSQYRRGAVDQRGWEWYYWMGQTHREFRTIEVEDVVDSLSFTPDGQRLVTGIESSNKKDPKAKRTIEVWDVKSGTKVPARALSTEELARYRTLASNGESECFSPDGQRQATADSEVTVRDTGSGKVLFTIRSYDRAGEEEIGNVESICFSPDGKRLATGSDDDTVTVWDASTGRRLVSIKLKGSGLLNITYSLCFSPDGQRLAAGNENRRIDVWDSNTGKEIFSLKGHKGPVRSLCFSPDGQRLATGSEDKTLKLWDLNTGKEILSNLSQLDEIAHICFSPDGAIMASCDDNGVVKLWPAAAERVAVPLAVGSGHVYISPDGRRLASVEPGAVNVWDAVDRKQLIVIPVTGSLGRLQFTPDGRRLATRVEDGTIKVWNVQDGRELFVPAGRMGKPRSTFNKVAHVSLSPDGRRVALDMHIWDVASGKKLLTVYQGDPICGFSPDGRRLSVGRFICDAETGKSVRGLRWYGTSFEHVCFSPDSSRVASAGQVWDVESGTRLFTFDGDISCFSPDGKRIASATPTGVRLVDADNGQELLTIKGLASGFSSVCFSADGQRLLAGHNDGTVEIWDAEYDDE